MLYAGGLGPLILSCKWDSPQMGYDGMYSSRSHDKEGKALCSSLKGYTKDVDKTFGALLSRWYILNKPCKFWTIDMVREIMKTIIVP